MTSSTWLRCSHQLLWENSTYEFMFKYEPFLWLLVFEICNCIPSSPSCDTHCTEPFTQYHCCLFHALNAHCNATYHFFPQDRASPCGCSSVTGTTRVANLSSPAGRVSTRSSTSIAGDWTSWQLSLRTGTSWWSQGMRKVPLVTPHSNSSLCASESLVSCLHCFFFMMWLWVLCCTLFLFNDRGVLYCASSLFIDSSSCTSVFLCSTSLLFSRASHCGQMVVYTYTQSISCFW